MTTDGQPATDDVRSAPSPGRSQRGWLRHRVALHAIAWVTFAATTSVAQSAQGPTYADLAPLLGQHCTVCHSSDAAPAGLRLDSYEALVRGGIKGPVVKSGDPSGSELIRRLKGLSQPRMPLTGPPFLSDEDVARFEQWIAGGLPRGEAAVTSVVPNDAVRPPAAGEPVTYRHVAPIFAKRCAKCHADAGLMGPPPEGYRLTSHAATLAAAERVRVVPGNPAASELVRRIRGQATPRMPLDGPPYLADDEIRLIEEWVAQGARSSEGVAAAVPKGAAVRLHGTLGPGNRLDGLPLQIGAGTRIDKSPGPGDNVRVLGHLDDAGNVIVERLRRR